jgi:hypothetical protein
LVRLEFWVVEILSRDKASLAIIWFRDGSLAEPDNLPDPDVFPLSF